MKTGKFTFLVVENAPDVCEGIIRRVEKFENWHPLGYCVGVKEAIEKINAFKPHLLFLDWSLNGGSAFEIMRHMQNMGGYNPYIIFNTGFQKDNPEIPQELINYYRVDKYLVKPLWENLRENLPIYLKEAEEKTQGRFSKNKTIWIKDVNGSRLSLQTDKLICICQHPSQPRSRIFYIDNHTREIHVPMQWHKCYELLQNNGIDYFISKKRSHLVIKKYIEKFEKPFIRLQNFPAKFEVVKENIKDFEKWLLGSEPQL